MTQRQVAPTPQKMNKENLPFTLSNSSELVNLNNSDSLDFLNHLPSLETIYEASSFSKYNLPDIDAETPNLVTSKYHTVANFQKLKIEKDFNLFHSNVDGLESKYDSLHAFFFLAGQWTLRLRVSSLILYNSSQCRLVHE